MMKMLTLALKVTSSPSSTLHLHFYYIFQLTSPLVLCFPSVGQHFIKYKGKYVTFNRTEDKSALSDDSGGLTIERGEELTVSYLPYFFHPSSSFLLSFLLSPTTLFFLLTTIQITLYHYNKDILNDLVKEAVDLNFAKLKNKTRYIPLFTSATYILLYHYLLFL